MQFHSVTLKIAAFVLLATPFASAVTCTEVGGQSGCSFRCYNLPGGAYSGGYCDGSKRFLSLDCIYNTDIRVRRRQLYMPVLRASSESQKSMFGVVYVLSSAVDRTFSSD